MGKKSKTSTIRGGKLGILVRQVGWVRQVRQVGWVRQVRQVR
jgi:hypothetical protein